MSNACTPILVGMTPPVSEIWLPFKNSQISLLGHGLYSPWSSKNLIDWNRLKKFMQVGVNVTCMYTNFGGCSFSNFGDIATFKNGQISLIKKFMLVGIDVKCMQNNFGGCSLSSFGDIATFKSGQISLSDHGL